MTTRIGLLVAVLALGAVALWHPLPRSPAPAAVVTARPLPPSGPHRFGERVDAQTDAVVYVAGAVRRPGLYHVGARDRAADAVAKAGGLDGAADAGGVNLAAHLADGDEIYVPVAGEVQGRHVHARSSRRGRSHRRGSNALQATAAESVDPNSAGEDELAAVPGIGAAIAARILEMRALDGAFTSLDQLLDVAGMTQTRLERARPFLRPP